MKQTTSQPIQVKLTNSTDNPFYGLKNCLALYQQAGKGNVNANLLNACWAEVRDNKVQREMFFSLLFSIGDITARQHNIFGKNKIDSGGNAQRMAFMTILSWLKNINYTQYRNFLFANLFNEYTSMDSILAHRVKTTKNKQTVETVFSSLSGDSEYLEDLSTFCANIILGNNPTHKYFLAKFLTRPRTSKRSGHKKMLPQTLDLMNKKSNFLLAVSRKANLDFEAKTGYINFYGYIEWRKQYLGELESVLFSSKKILEFDKQQFLTWLDKLPSGARYRVRCRLLDKDNKPKTVTVSPKKGNIDAIGISKWNNLPKWFLEWENYKNTKQTEVRVLEDKIRQGNGNQDDVVKLAKVKKEAKVTVGAVDFVSMFTQIIQGTIDKVKVQPFLDKINLPYNSLVFLDDSSSMQSNFSRDYRFSAFDFANFMAAICLTKNPDDDARSLLGYFSGQCRLFSGITQVSNTPNRIVLGNVKKVSEPFIKPTDHFLDNLHRLRSFSNSIRTGQGTNISSIPDYLAQEIKNNPDILEQLQRFPVWTIISDGNWNNMSSPEGSMNDFMAKCQKYLGFKPFIIAIDVSSSSASIERFQGIENFMYIPPNPAQIEQLLTNFKDMDIMDVYTPLQSLYRSNRYDLVKKYTI